MINRNDYPTYQHYFRATYHPGYAAEQVKKFRLKCRRECFEHYGKYCHCPGCDVKEECFLAFDHIFGNGKQHKKDEREPNLAVWLWRNKFPEGFRVLCHNCNLARGFYGYCKHGGKKYGEKA